MKFSLIFMLIVPIFGHPTNETRALSAPEARIGPVFHLMIWFPKLLYKVAKAVTVGLAMGFLSTFLLCTFTPVCILGLALPGLARIERSGRSLVENLEPGKVEAAAEMLSNVLDKYAKIRISDVKREERLKRINEI